MGRALERLGSEFRILGLGYGVSGFRRVGVLKLALGFRHVLGLGFGSWILVLASWYCFGRFDGQIVVGVELGQLGFLAPDAHASPKRLSEVLGSF